MRTDGWMDDLHGFDLLSFALLTFLIQLFHGFAQSFEIVLPVYHHISQHCHHVVAKANKKKKKNKQKSLAINFGGFAFCLHVFSPSLLTIYLRSAAKVTVPTSATIMSEP